VQVETALNDDRWVEPLLNAITGFNGSKKSNILDAICFVLGLANMTNARAPLPHSFPALSSRLARPGPRPQALTQRPADPRADPGSTWQAGVAVASMAFVFDTPAAASSHRCVGHV
jgi:hypothetical protein